jgi:hypothetical protein
MVMKPTLNSIPPILLLTIDSLDLVFDPILSFNFNDKIVNFKLRGLIYGGHGHFTCRFVDDSGVMWYNDGMVTGRMCRREQSLSEIVDRRSLNKCLNNKVVAVVYAVA